MKRLGGPMETVQQLRPMTDEDWEITLKIPKAVPQPQMDVLFREALEHTLKNLAKGGKAQDTTTAGCFQGHLKVGDLI